MSETILKKKKMKKLIQFNFDKLIQTHSPYNTCKEFILWLNFKIDIKNIMDKKYKNDSSMKLQTNHININKPMLILYYFIKKNLKIKKN